MILIGAVALYGLPVAQYPDVVRPTVQVTTRYPGASALTLLDTVALPIEQQVNGVENMIYMQSTSASDGSYTLTVTFKIGTDLDNAQILVQNRVASALSQLPTPVQAQGVTVQKRSTAILLFVTLTAPDGRYDSLYLANYATIKLRDELSRLPGVGNVKRSPPARSARRRRRRASISNTPSIYPAALPTSGSSRTSSSRPAITDRSHASATSARSSSAPRPTANISTSTASKPPASASFSRPAPTRSTSSTRSGPKWKPCRAISRKAWSTRSRSTPRSS